MTARLYFRLRFLLYLTFREFAVILILQKGFTCEGAMEGIFKRRIKEYIWAGILAFIGVVCTASFSVIMILALAEHEAASGDSDFCDIYCAEFYLCHIRHRQYFIEIGRIYKNRKRAHLGKEQFRQAT